jgi:asparagine synthase (glutamine-hydrolysing)
MYVDSDAALAFRRLSVIDLVTGNQPIPNETKRVWAVLNGEIYNYRELRHELASRGHIFSTSGDTECIVHGYESWGESVFEHLNGMFAIAIWDANQRKFVIGRDRAGEKPLYYWHGQGKFVFASEIKALLLDPGIGRSIDWQAFDEYCSFGFVSSPRTMFDGIHKLPAGHFLVVGQQSALGETSLEANPYWRLDLSQRFRGTYLEAQEQCLALLDEAVRIRMISDVPLGAFLSGGVDSSAVVSCMAQHSSGPVKTFSIGFDHQEHDETSFAQLVATHYGTENVKLVVTPEYADSLEHVLLNFDEPFADSSAIPTYVVSQLTRRHVTVALSGDGGDELFGGYPTYAMMLRVSKLARTLPHRARPWLRRISEVFPKGSLLQRRFMLLGMEENERFVRFISLLKPEDKEQLYTSKTHAAVMGTDVAACRKVDQMNRVERDYVNRMQLSDFDNYLPDDILTKVDRTSMLVSLETRAPFLDHRLVEFAFSLPGDWKVSPSRSKIVLKDAFSKRLPAPILRRRKMGFSMPLKQWLATDLYEFCRRRILSREMTALFDERILCRLLQQHRNGSRDHSSKLWLLICFSLWLASHELQA